jgi:hypothetical protein
VKDQDKSGEYEIYHYQGEIQGQDSVNRIPDDAFPSQYRRHATVTASDFGDARIISHMQDIQSLGEIPERQTRTGDVIVGPGGKAIMIGFLHDHRVIVVDPDPIPTPEEARAIRDEWTQDYALRSMPESVRDAEANPFGAVMEAVGNSPLPESIVAMERDYYRSLNAAALADTPSEEKPVVYQVWQADMPAREGEAQLDFPEAYTKVASVEARSLAEAAELTKHSDHPWQENPGVEGEVGARSTGVGDVIVAPDGKSHRIEAEGFSAVRSTYEKQLDEAAERGKYIPKNDRGIER